jgi:uncharacterized membrane protein YgdD (TMEM256/DUF423 family)
MMLPHSQVKIFASTDVVDMRFGFDRLAQTVKAAMGHDPFSGSLYLLALTGITILGAITPLGGLAFLAGWACLAFAAI